MSDHDFADVDGPTTPEALAAVQEQVQKERHERSVREQLDWRRARAEADRLFEAEQQQKATAERRLRVVDGERFLADDDADEKPIWGTADTPIWAAGEPLMICGPNGVGKSTLSHLLVFARIGIDGHGKVLDLPVQPSDGKVFYIAADRPRQIKRAMRRLREPEHLQVLRERLIVHEGPLPFDITRDKDTLADLAQEYGATSIFIDSLKDLCPKPADETDANGYNRARQEAVARGIEWVEDHHNRKAQGDNKKPDTIEDVYGSRWLTAGAGSILCLFGEPGAQQVKLTQLKSPGGFIRPQKLTIDHTRGLMGANVVVDVWTFIKSKPHVTVAEVAKFNAHDRGIATVTDGLIASARKWLNQQATTGALVKGEDPETKLTIYSYNVAHQLTLRVQGDGGQEDGLGGWQG